MVEFRRNTNLCLTANNAVSNITTANVEFIDIVEVEFDESIDVDVEFAPKYLFASEYFIGAMKRQSNCDDYKIRYFKRKIVVTLTYNK